MSKKESSKLLPPEVVEAIKTEEDNPGRAAISLFKNRKERSPSEEICVLGFALNVRLGTYQKKIEQIREFMDQGDHERADALKRLLPAVSLSGMVTEGLRASAHKEGRFQHSGYLQGDFDTKDFHPRSPDEIKAVLAADEHVQAVFLSAKRGVKAIIRIPVCESPAEHRAAFIAADAYFREQYRLELDASTKDPGRLCYVSYDPEAYVNYSPATVLPVAAEEKPSDESRGSGELSKHHTTNGNNAGAKHGKLTLKSIKEMLACIPPRPNYDTWLKISSAVWAATDDEATGSALLKDWSPEEETGEYSEKFKSRLREIAVGTLIHHAKKHGFEFPSGQDNGNDMSIPDNVFPVPTGEIEYNRAGDIIFKAIAPSHTIFMRGATPHEVIVEADGPAYFKPLCHERFCSLIEKYDHRIARAEWQESKKKYVWRSSRMPQNSAKILLNSDPARQHLPPVCRLAACPILTFEARVLVRGYHNHAGGTYITEGEEPSEVPIEAAINAILGLLDDFDFVTPADKSRALANILSPALKMGEWIEDDFPMDVAEAEQSQGGKSYRLKLNILIYNEVPSAITAPRGGVGSLDETISSALIKGRPFITLDNFRGALDSTILEQAIRGVRRVTCRALRTSADVDTRPFNWQLSTNGAEFTRDIANRSIITRIRKQKPGYKFKKFEEGDLHAHVIANQPFYLGAVFSILREWKRHGCPETDESRHDFRGWCRALDWIVQNIFKLAPLLDGHREEQARTANPALQWLREVSMAVRSEKQMGRELTTAELISIAEGCGVDFPGNRGGREDPCIRAGKILGKVFRATDGQPVTVDGLTVTRTEPRVYTPGRGAEMQKMYTIAEAAP